MSEILPALPLDWTKKIFSRMAAIYGSQFSAKWDSENMETVLSVWAEELRNFGSTPGAIKYALEHLPSDYPPNLLQFKELCREGLKFEPKPLAIERKLTHEEAEFNRLKIEQVAKTLKPASNHRKWIQSLQTRRDTGERFSPSVERVHEDARDIERMFSF